MNFSEFRQQVDAYILSTWLLSKTATTTSEAKPIFAFVSPKDKTIIYSNPPMSGFQDAVLKDFQAMLLHQMCQVLKLAHTCLITEAWMLKADTQNPEEVAELHAFTQSGKSYSTHPKAKEVLCVAYSTAEIPHNVQITYEIDRSSGNPVLTNRMEVADEADQETISGRFAGLYYDSTRK